MAGESPLLIPFEALKAMGIGLSRHTIRRLSLTGKFPKARKLGGHRIVFFEAEVRDWIANLPVAGPLRRRRKKSTSSEGGK